VCTRDHAHGSSVMILLYVGRARSFVNTYDGTTGASGCLLKKLGRSAAFKRSGYWRDKGARGTAQFRADQTVSSRCKIPHPHAKVRIYGGASIRISRTTSEAVATAASSAQQRWFNRVLCPPPVVLLDSSRMMRTSPFYEHVLRNSASSCATAT